jgi:hypothetical protein
MTSQLVQYLNASLVHGFYQNPCQQHKFYWKPGDSQNPGPYPPVHTQ